MKFEEIGEEAVLHILEYIPIQVSRYEFTLDLFRFSGISRLFYKLVWKRLKGLRIKSRLCVRYIFRKDVPEPIFQRMLRLKTLSNDTSTQRSEIFIASVCKGYCKVVESFLQNKEYNIDPSDMENEAIREASKEGQLEMVKCLVTDPRVDPSDSGNEALVSAARGNFTELAKFLMSDPRVLEGEGGEEAADYASTKEMEDLIRKTFKNYKAKKSFHLTLKKLKEYLESFQEELSGRIDGYIQVRTLSGLQNWVKRFHQDMNLEIKKYKLKSNFEFSSLPAPCPYITPSQREEYDRKLSSIVDSFGCIPVPRPKKEEDENVEEEEEEGHIGSHYVGNLDPLYSRPHGGKGMIYDVGAYLSLKIRISGNFQDGLIHGPMGREYHRHNGALKFVGHFKKGLRAGRGIEFGMDGRAIKRRGVWEDKRLVSEDRREDIKNTEAWLELPYEEYNIVSEEEEEEKEEEEVVKGEFPSPPPSPTSEGEESEEIFQEEDEEEEKKEEDEGEEEEEEIKEVKEEKEEDSENITRMKFSENQGGVVNLDQSLEESILYQNLEKRSVVQGKKLHVLYGLIKENRKQRLIVQASHEELEEEVQNSVKSDLVILERRLKNEKVYHERQIVLLRRMIESQGVSFWEGWKGILLSFFFGVIVCYAYIILLQRENDDE